MEIRPFNNFYQSEAEISNFQEIYIKYYDSILKQIKYKSNNHYSAEDLTQDLFLKILESQNQLNTKTIKSYLYTIAHNLLIDFKRKKYNRIFYGADMLEFFQTETGENAENQLFCNQLINLEIQKINSFTAQQKKIYYMKRFAEKSIPEISEHLSLSVRTVESHLFLSRKIMRNYLLKCI